MSLISIVSYSKDYNRNLYFVLKVNDKLENSIKNPKVNLQNFIQKQDSVKKGDNPNQVQKTAKKPFFGTVYCYGLPPVNGTGPCEVGVFQTFYLFGLKISGPNAVMESSKKNEQILTQVVVGCGEEYIPQKTKDKNDKKTKKEEKRMNEKKTRKEDNFLEEI